MLRTILTIDPKIRREFKSGGLKIISKPFRQFVDARFNARHWIARFTLLTTVLLVAACVGAPTLPDSTELIAPAQIADEETAQDAWRASQTAKNARIWQRESRDDGDPYAAGQPAYALALVTFEPEWSKAAIGEFEKSLKQGAEFEHRARAGLGAANRLAAHDFPIQGVAQYLFFGTPGAVRSNHVRLAFSHLNEAVEAAPDDPVVRVYRAAAFIGIPSLFGGRDDGLADYEQLDE